MYSAGPPMIPPPNFCPPQNYGNNFPYQPPYGPTFYPPVCNYYNNAAPGPYYPPNSHGNGPQSHNFNPTSQMPLFSQPPPGYGTNGAQTTHNSCNNNNPVASYQPVHMANVCSTAFNGFATPNPVPISNQYSRPPPTSPQMNGRQKNNTDRFSNHGNNGRIFEAKNSPYFCEACDRGFMSLNKFTQHKSEHVTCGQEGCTFTGHAKIVEKHYMMQHRTGLFNRIVKGYSPEEIQKWITDRKKHFPTKDKIEVKQAQREEMQKRGERYAERRQRSNQRNSNFRSGSNNRFNRSTPNRNGQFTSNSFRNRRNSTRDRTGESQNKRKEPVIRDEDCVLRNILPFKGTAYYLSMENNSMNGEHEEYTISDDDNYSVLSGDDDIIPIDYNSSIVNKNVISELEESSVTSHVADTEEDCLDKYFKNCDAVEETEEEIDNSNKPDETSTIITNSKIDDTKLPTDPMVNHLIVPEPPVYDKPILKATSSLALIQYYDSDSNDDEDDDTSKQTNYKISTPSLDKIESKKIDSSEDDEPDECSSKCIRIEKITLESNSSTLNKIESEKKNDSGDDSGPDECPSKSLPIEMIFNGQSDSSSLKNIEPEKINDIEPVVCSSNDVVEAADLSLSNKEDEENKGCESKRRKRKRRRDSKGETECDAENDKKPAEKKLPPVPRPRARKRYKPPTLLEKLLSSEIKHERNVVLQCIRYVVDNDYFNVGKSDSS